MPSLYQILCGFYLIKQFMLPVLVSMLLTMHHGKLAVADLVVVVLMMLVVVAFSSHAQILKKG